MTAYRQEALRCAAGLAAGPTSPRAIRAGGDVPHAGRILQENVYGWFERVERGIYALSPRGRGALDESLAVSVGPPSTVGSTIPDPVAGATATAAPQR